MERSRTNTLNNKNESSQTQNKDIKNSKSYSISHTNAIYNRLRGKRLINMKIQNRIELVQNQSRDKVTVENSDIQEAGDETEIVHPCDNESSEENVKTREIALSSENINIKDYIEIPGEDLKGTVCTRIVVIGDHFLSSYHEFWPTDSKIKPYFLFKNKLSIDEICFKFQEHPFLKNSKKIILLFVLGLHDFVQYGTHINESCKEGHRNIQYIEELKSIKGYAKKLLDVKEKYSNENLSVLFSYFPSLHNVRLLKDIFNWSKDDSLDCGCSVNDLDCVAEKFIKSDFFAITQIYQRYMTTVQINVVRDHGVFEYIPPAISFLNGEWKLAMDRKEKEKNIAVLNHILNEFVFDIDDSDKSKTTNIREGLLSMRNLIVKKNFRIALIGDKWIASVAYQWPGSYPVNPFFYFQDNFMFRDLRKAILTLVKGDEFATVIVTVPAGEFFTMRSSAKCEGHKSLEYPVPNDRILKNPINFAHQLIEKMNVLMQEIKHLRKNCVIVFINCYPVQLASYYEYLTEAHSQTVGESVHMNSGPLIDVNFSEFDAQLLQCFDMINQYIQTANDVQNYPLCNISQVVNSSNEKFIFPTYIEDICPSTCLARELFNLLKLYVGIFNRTSLHKIVSVTLADQYVRKLKMTEMKKSNKRASEMEDLKKNKREKLDSSTSGKESYKSSRSRDVSSASHSHGSSSKKLHIESKDSVSKSVPSSGDRPSVAAIKSLAMLGDRKLVIARSKELGNIKNSSQAIKQACDEDTKTSSKDRPSLDVLRSLAALGDRKLVLANAKEAKSTASHIESNKNSHCKNAELSNNENSHSVLENTSAKNFLVDQNKDKLQNLEKVACDNPKKEPRNKSKHPPKGRPSGDILKFLAALGDRKLATAKAMESDRVANNTQGTITNSDNSEKFKSGTNCLNQQPADTSEDSVAVTSGNKKATVLASDDKKASTVASSDQKTSVVASSDQKAFTVASCGEKTYVASDNQQASFVISGEQKVSAAASDGQKGSCNDDDKPLQDRSLFDTQRFSGVSSDHQIIKCQQKNLEVSPTKKICSTEIAGKASSKNIQSVSDDHLLVVDQRPDKLRDSDKICKIQEKCSNHKTRKTLKDHPVAEIRRSHTTQGAYQFTMEHLEDFDQSTNIAQKNINSSTKNTVEANSGNSTLALDPTKFSVVACQKSLVKLLDTSSVASNCQKQSSDENEVVLSKTYLSLDSTRSPHVLKYHQISMVHDKETNSPMYNTFDNNNSQRSDESNSESQQLACEHSFAVDSSNKVEHVDKIQCVSKSRKESDDETREVSLKDVSAVNTLKSITAQEDMMQTVSEDAKAEVLLNSHSKTSSSNEHTTGIEERAPSESNHQLTKILVKDSDLTSCDNQKKDEADNSTEYILSKDKTHAALEDHQGTIRSHIKNSDLIQENNQNDTLDSQSIQKSSFETRPSYCSSMNDCKSNDSTGQQLEYKRNLDRSEHGHGKKECNSSIGRAFSDDHVVIDDRRSPILNDHNVACAGFLLDQDKKDLDKVHVRKPAKDRPSVDAIRSLAFLGDRRAVKGLGKDAGLLLRTSLQRKKESENGNVHSSSTAENLRSHFAFDDHKIQDAVIKEADIVSLIQGNSASVVGHKSEGPSNHSLVHAEDSLGNDHYLIDKLSDSNALSVSNQVSSKTRQGKKRKKKGNSNRSSLLCTDRRELDVLPKPPPRVDNNQARYHDEATLNAASQDYSRNQTFPGKSRKAKKRRKKKKGLANRLASQERSGSNNFPKPFGTVGDYLGSHCRQVNVDSEPRGSRGNASFANESRRVFSSGIQQAGTYDLPYGDHRCHDPEYDQQRIIPSEGSAMMPSNFQRGNVFSNSETGYLPANRSLTDSYASVGILSGSQMINVQLQNDNQMANQRFNNLQTTATQPQGNQMCRSQIRSNRQMGTQLKDDKLLNVETGGDDFQMSNLQGLSDRQIVIARQLQSSQMSIDQARGSCQMTNVQFSDRQMMSSRLQSSRLACVQARSDRHMTNLQEHNGRQIIGTQLQGHKMSIVPEHGNFQMSNVQSYDSHMTNMQLQSGQLESVQARGSRQMTNVQDYNNLPMARTHLFSDQLASVQARGDAQMVDVQGYSDRQMASEHLFSDHFTNVESRADRQMANVQSRGNRQMANVQGYSDRQMNSAQFESSQLSQLNRQITNVRGFCDHQITRAQLQSNHLADVQARDNCEMASVHIQGDYQMTNSQGQCFNAASDGYQEYNEAIHSPSNPCHAVKDLASKVYRLMTSSKVSSSDNAPAVSQRNREFYNEPSRAPINNSPGVQDLASKLYNIMSDSKFKEPYAKCPTQSTVDANNETLHQALSEDRLLSSTRSHVLSDDHRVINANIQSEMPSKYLENKESCFEASQTLQLETEDIHQTSAVGGYTSKGQLNDNVMSNNIQMNKSSDTEHRQRTTKRISSSPSISSTGDDHGVIAATGINQTASILVKNSDTVTKENWKNKESSSGPTQAPPGDRPPDSILRSFASIGDLNAKNTKDPAAITWVLR